MKEILKVDTKFIIMGLVAIFLLGLPVRIQNINLDGYISDDAWWHYRQIREVVEHGRRPKVDIYEFTTLNRPMTYPPYFHYLLGYGYRIFGRGMPLIKFTHYVNLMESFLYILIIYWLSLILTGDKLMSLLGCVAASSIYAMIIRARAGELMAFVVSDLFGLAGLAVMLSLVKAKENKFLFLGSAVGGVLFGLSALSWEGALYIYLPLLVLLFVAVLIYDNSRGKKKSLKLFAPALMLTTVITLSWYAPLVAKYGFNPHPRI